MVPRSTYIMVNTYPLSIFSRINYVVFQQVEYSPSKRVNQSLQSIQTFVSKKIELAKKIIHAIIFINYTEIIAIHFYS